MPYWFDGNNLIGQSTAAARADAGIHKAFLGKLSGLQRSGGGRFIVYFDGDDHHRAASPPGVNVRYSAPLSADKAILARLKEIRHPQEVIVVTNDRQLSARCLHAGAKAMNWQEFTNKMKSRSTARQKRSTQEKPVDVDDWAKYFGFDKTKL